MDDEIFEERKERIAALMATVTAVHADLIQMAICYPMPGKVREAFTQGIKNARWQGAHQSASDIESFLFLFDAYEEVAKNAPVIQATLDKREETIQ